MSERPRPLPRIFLGFIDICGVYRSLEHALRDLGCKACFLNLGNDLVEHETVPAVPRWFKRVHLEYARVGSRRSDRGRLFSAVHQRLWRTTHLFAVCVLLLWIAARFDVVMLKSGNSLTASGIDLKLLKLLGKTIIVSYHGSDSRPAYLSGTAAVVSDPEAGMARVRAQAESFARSARYADYTIDSPTSAHLQRTLCCLRQIIGNPVPAHRLAAACVGQNSSPQFGESRALRVLHAPSNPALKGTDVIEQAIGTLRKAGLDFEFRMVSGVTNVQLLREVARSDIVVDEVYSDNFGGILALESLTLGKPVVVCGYAQEELRRFVPAWAVLPTEYCHPDELESVLGKLLTDSEYRNRRCQEIRRFIDEVASPRATAQRLLLLADGDAPEEWFFDPPDIRYVGGAAGKLEAVRANVRAVINAGGVSALGVCDKPALEQRLVRFAAGNEDFRAGDEAA